MPGILINCYYSAFCQRLRQGVGINFCAIEKIFERYYRVESSTTLHISGFGTGLYLSAEIIMRHDGKIWMDSIPGEGSTFNFTLPRHKT